MLFSLLALLSAVATLAVPVSPGDDSLSIARCYYNATWVLSSVSPDVASAVADGQMNFSLLPTSMAPNHPLLMEFGSMTCDITMLPGHHSWAEMVIAVPFLGLQGYKGPFNYQARAYTSKELAVLGDAIVAYQAATANITSSKTDATDMHVSDSSLGSKGPIADAEFTPGTGEFVKAKDLASTSPNFSMLMDMKSQSMVGLRDIAGLKIHECSHIAYDWDQVVAKQGVAGSVYFDQSPSLKGIDAGARYSWLAGDSTAFEVKAHFSLTFPAKCPAA